MRKKIAFVAVLSIVAAASFAATRLSRNAMGQSPAQPAPKKVYANPHQYSDIGYRGVILTQNNLG
jgi:hypothetical protein